MDGTERVKAGRRSRSRTPSWSLEEVFVSATHSQRSSRVEDEEALTWAAIEKLPTYDRLRTGIIQSIVESEYPQRKNNKMVHKEVDVLKLDVTDRQDFIDRIFKVAEEDNEKFLKKFRSRIDK